VGAALRLDGENRGSNIFQEKGISPRPFARFNEKTPGRHRSPSVYNGDQAKEANLISRETTTQVAFRLPDELLERVDRHAERMREAQPGVNVSRTDVVRMLLTRALEHAESELQPKRAKR
jgi:hypothetical protein